MKLNSLLSFIFLAAIACSPKENSQSDHSLTHSELLSEQSLLSVLWYQQSAEMKAIYAQSYNLAKILMERNLDELEEGQRPAVILDIDETVLDNSPFQEKMIERGETFSVKAWNEWVDRGEAKLLPGAKDFLEFAGQKGVAIFYISNRHVSTFDATLENLKKFNLPQANADHLLLKEETSNKTARRNKVNEEYKTILFIGDNLTDFKHSYANRGEDMGTEYFLQTIDSLLKYAVILPNPMYGEWEHAIYNNQKGAEADQKVKFRKKHIESGY
ncbi:5'-nucleotidase, lipoprotein e(P4) family [Aureibacter tunicatorum]|uniref:5'-nucleotidase (Lipoprotein e(P4) family) n=1 Tax=Aureibacter tunicatorum TaxID=866807 RepID=A0AAE4BUD1_9BACT|nr:5'-nucleotidase, lipoprotein e(P4) family [Aureibacter tunicatorum]MDR6240643.1 5'-nucleotidase (lipoprotein e(P4) family) [Aureibacter tunicatorum]BDD06496.1 5'-nucleotidase, lipoprotein e(P4) family [Aureibacter tunicatorum]